MKKNRYSLIELPKHCGRKQLDIFESAQQSQSDKGEGSSQVDFISNTTIGSLKQNQKSCCFMSGDIHNLELLMYDQHLSIAETMNKSCFSLYLCKHQLVVATAKRVLIGKVTRHRQQLLSSRIEITNDEDQLVYTVRSQCCQLFKILPKFLGCLRCRPAIYEIVDAEGEVEGSIKVYHSNCCYCSEKYEVELPEKADTKTKILIMNAIFLLG